MCDGHFMLLLSVGYLCLYWWEGCHTTESYESNKGWAILHAYAKVSMCIIHTRARGPVTTRYTPVCYMRIPSRCRDKKNNHKCYYC